MQCSRCGCEMAYEKFEEFVGLHVDYFYGWRCYSCGEILDGVIQKNRLKTHQMVKTKTIARKRNYFIPV